MALSDLLDKRWDVRGFLLLDDGLEQLFLGRRDVVFQDQVGQTLKDDGSGAVIGHHLIPAGDDNRPSQGFHFIWLSHLAQIPSSRYIFSYG